MVKIEVRENGIELELDAKDTYNWAHKDGAAWPCSTLSGHEVWAEFEEWGLMDYTIDGKGPDPETGKPHIDGMEFSAMTCDFMRPYVPIDHGCYWVNVGQFLVNENTGSESHREDGL